MISSISWPTLAIKTLKAFYNVSSGDNMAEAQADFYSFLDDDDKFICEALDLDDFDFFEGLQQAVNLEKAVTEGEVRGLIRRDGWETVAVKILFLWMKSH